MRRRWQIFVAPGEEDDPLPVGGSPWVLDRWVRVPREHWEIILAFGENFDAGMARRIDGYSLAADRNEVDYIHTSPGGLEAAAGFLETLSGKSPPPPPLSPSRPRKCRTNTQTPNISGWSETSCASFANPCGWSSPSGPGSNDPSGAAVCGDAMYALLAADDRHAGWRGHYTEIANHDG